MNTSKEYSTNQDQTERKKIHEFENYDEYLEWLKENFFNWLRKLAEETPVLITGFIMDKNGVIAKDGKVPSEIANDRDWKAFMRYLASADVFVTGMRYMEQTVKAIKKENEFQNTLFPYENPEEDDFLNKLNAKFFPEIGDLREANGLPRSPDIFIATTGLEDREEVLKDENFKEIVERIKKQGRNIVIIKKGDFTEKEIKLMENAGIEEWRSYTPPEEELGGKEFIETIVSWYKSKRRKDINPIIANTTGPRIKALFFEAGYPLFLEATLVQTNVGGDDLTYLEGNKSLGNPIEHLENSGFNIIAQTTSLEATAVNKTAITQEFYIFGKNYINISSCLHLHPPKPKLLKLYSLPYSLF